MRLTGLNRFANRVRFDEDVVAASLQISWTKETGSIGERVLKKTTDAVLSIAA